ncbi:TPA: inositol monophosphatase [Providencia stuartii]|nr:inositol monophosphatase [Providencia stuartii]HEM8188166.1 inositol monophosphatase [Providencia stuartii]HEM8218319.1 inositol monophosphatase [Providencia stuartii]
MGMNAISARYTFIQQVVIEAGKLAVSYYHDRNQLNIEKKKEDGQDLVTIADKNTEQFIREKIHQQYPLDALFGEEGGYTQGASQYTWVIDPIDGTSAFIFGLPSWCISIALLDEQQNTQIAVVYDPVQEELFHAMAGHGAYLNQSPIQVNAVQSLNEGLFGVGISTRLSPEYIIPFLDKLLHAKGMFIRNGSAALMLAYVAAGKLIGYYEPHLNSWDCLAGLLLIQEAGGVMNNYKEKDDFLLKGNYVLASSPGVYQQLASFRD